MSYAYPSVTPYPPSRRDPAPISTSTSESPNLLIQLRDALPPWIRQVVAKMRSRPLSTLLQTGRGNTRSYEFKSTGRILVGRLVTLANLLILLWFWVLWWGERSVFRDSLEGCAWGNWEAWVKLSSLTLESWCIDG